MQVIPMPIHVEDLYPLVVKEAEQIKKNFSNEEIDSLKLGEIDPTSPYKCIYGTMTGDCNSSRVKEFIETNIPVVIDTEGGQRGDPEYRSAFYMTPLERYIDGEYDENEELEYSTVQRIKKVIKLLQN